MIILIVCRRLGFWTDWRLKGKKRRRGFLPGPLLWQCSWMAVGRRGLPAA